MHIDQIIDHIFKIPEASKSALKAKIIEISYPKGHILLKQDKIEKEIYFIKKGMVRAYVMHEEHEITFWFGKEGDPIVSMKSYVEMNKGYESVELLEDCDLFALSTTNLQTLYQEDIHIANWGRKFAEFELIKAEERLISLQFKTAIQRYQDLLKYYPELIQRVQLGHIASYLGITQVTLSRIRAEIK